MGQMHVKTSRRTPSDFPKAPSTAEDGTSLCPRAASPSVRAFVCIFYAKSPSPYVCFSAHSFGLLVHLFY